MSFRLAPTSFSMKTHQRPRTLSSKPWQAADGGKTLRPTEDARDKVIPSRPFLVLLAITDKVAVSAVASRIRKDSPQRPPRRSARLNSIPSLKNIDPSATEQPYTGGRRSLRPGLRTSTENAVKPSLIIACTPLTRGQKRVREDSDSEDKKRRRTSNTTPATEETSRQDEDGDAIDYCCRSGYCSKRAKMGRH